MWLAYSSSTKQGARNFTVPLVALTTIWSDRTAEHIMQKMESLFTFTMCVGCCIAFWENRALRSYPQFPRLTRSWHIIPAWFLPLYQDYLNLTFGSLRKLFLKSTFLKQRQPKTISQWKTETMSKNFLSLIMAINKSDVHQVDSLRIFFFFFWESGLSLNLLTQFHVLCVVEGWRRRVSAVGSRDPHPTCSPHHHRHRRHRLEVHE